LAYQLLLRVLLSGEPENAFWNYGKVLTSHAKINLNGHGWKRMMATVSFCPVRLYTKNDITRHGWRCAPCAM